MKVVKAVPVNKQTTGGKCRWHRNAAFKKTNNKMKTLTKIALLAAILTTAAAAHADWVGGYFRSSGTYVAPYYRTPANSIPYDNLSYRGYPSQQPGYVSPRTYDFGTVRTLPAYPSTSYARPLYRNPYAY